MTRPAEKALSEVLQQLQTQFLLQILEHLQAGKPGQAIDPIARAACVGAYVQLCSLNPDEPLDRYLTSPSSGALYKIHLPANPEGALSQLILPIVVLHDSRGLCALVSTLNECLQDAAVSPGVKLHTLNVENSLVRRAVTTELPAEELALGREFCAIRRALALDVMDNPSRYFRPEDAAVNESVLHGLYGLYVDTERDLYLRVAQGNAVMPFFDDVLTAISRREQILARVFQSAIVANQRAALITVEAMREKLDRYRETLNGPDIDRLDRMIEYHEGGQDDIDIRDVTIQLENATFRGTDLGQIYTVMRFVLPIELKEDIPDAKKGGTSLIGRYEIALRRIASVYEDPLVAFLANIGSEKIGGLPTSFLSDVNPELQAGSTLVVLVFDGCVALDFDVTAGGAIVEKACEDEKAMRGGRFFPHKEEAIKLLRALYRENPDQFPLKCELEGLHVDAFSNYLVDYCLKSTGNIFGNIPVHQKSYLLTSGDAFARARMRHADKIGKLYRQDERVSIKALLENSAIRTNESLRDFVHKVLELTVKDWVERHSCWSYLWEGAPKVPRSEPDIHPFINSYLRTVLELKGIRVSREVRMANGAIDFFCSFTTPRNDVLKVCIEVKNAHGAGLESGVSKQLPAYMDAEHTAHGIYLVMWYKGANWPKPEEFVSIEEMRTKFEAVKPTGTYKIELIVVNCTKPVSPSKM